MRTIGFHPNPFNPAFKRYGSKINPDTPYLRKVISCISSDECSIPNLVITENAPQMKADTRPQATPFSRSDEPEIMLYGHLCCGGGPGRGSGGAIPAPLFKRGRARRDVLLS